MNNRYFGNIHDFCKYGLLRLLVGLLPLGGEPKKLFESLGVCWMLTEDISNKQGVGHEFLENTGKWGMKRIDEELFSKLRGWRDQNKLRTEGVNLLSSSDLLCRAKFFDAPIEGVRREKYFEEMREQFKDRDLIFLDPDYGLALGARDWGPGFLPASEVVKCWQGGFSVMFYQSQYGSQPNSTNLIRHELRRAFGEILPPGGIPPPVYAIEADMKEAGFAGRDEEAGKISPKFFLLPRQPGKREKVRNFLSDFRAQMWRREGKEPVFNIPGRVGVFIDYDGIRSMEKVRFVHQEIRDGGMIDWRDEFADKSGLFWNGEDFRGREKSGKKLRAEKPQDLEGLPVVKVDVRGEAVDAEISKRIRECVEHGEVDAVVLYASDKDYKLDAVVAKKHNVHFFQILRGKENPDNFGHGRRLFVIKGDAPDNFRLEEIKR